MILFRTLDNLKNVVEYKADKNLPKIHLHV